MKAMITLAIAMLSAACSSGEPEDPYARENALPAECRAYRTNMTMAEAGQLAKGLLPTVPIKVQAVTRKDADRHMARRDPVTGVYTLTLVDGYLSGVLLAHELAHIAVMDAYRNTAPAGQPSNEGSPPVHGEVFYRAFKVFLVPLTDRLCADAL